MTTKLKILSAALKLFAAQGIGKTSTAQITKEVGIASGTLFVHFKTKQILIDELYIQIKKHFFSSVKNAINPNASVEENHKILARKMVEHFLKNYDEFVFMELIENDPQVSEEALQEGREIFADLLTVTEEWKKSGIYKQVPTELIHMMFWNACNVIIRYCKSQDIKTPDDAFLDITWDAIKA